MGGRGSGDEVYIEVKGLGIGEEGKEGQAAGV